MHITYDVSTWRDGPGDFFILKEARNFALGIRIRPPV